MVLLRAIVFVAGLSALVANIAAGDERSSIADGIHEHIQRAVQADFDDFARDYVVRKAKELNRQVSWWDLYGEHGHLKERPQYSRYKISTSVSDMKYEKVTNKVDMPSVVYNKWFHNGQSQNSMTAKIARQTKTESTFTWKVRRGLSIKTELKAEFSVPSIMDLTTSFSTSLDLSKSETKTVKDTDTFTISYDLSVSPNTSVNAQWTIIERQVQIPWEADVRIDGYLAVWYHTKHNGHWLWFYPTWMLAGGEFKQSGNGLLYHTSGVFTGVRGVDSDFRITEYPLKPFNPITGEPLETPKDPIRAYSVPKEIPGIGGD